MSNWKNILNLPTRRSNNYTGNPWQQQYYPVIPSTSLSRKDDLTLSLGRETNHDEVEGLLYSAGCMKVICWIMLSR